jgi:hypothetical protein
MEPRFLLRVSFENAFTVALLSGVAYLGVVGAQMLVKRFTGKGA